jgi:hypothetical protein
MRVHVQPGTYSIVKLPPDALLPDLRNASWYSITRTPNELSIVAPEELIPKFAETRSDAWRCLTLDHTFNLTLTGITATIAKAMAEVGIPIFPVSSFDTDHFLVPESRCEEAVKIIERLELPQ